MKTVVKSAENGTMIPKLDKESASIINNLAHNKIADKIEGVITTNLGEDRDAAPPYWEAIDKLSHNKDYDIANNLIK